MHIDDYFDALDKEIEESEIDNGEKFTYFWRNKSVFSQWHKATFEDDGVMFNCTEQYMMYEKARLMKDKESMRKIISVDNPRVQKSLGRLIDNFDQDRWDENKYDIVYKGNFLKFSQNKLMKQELLATKGSTLVEASPYDKIWGIGLEESHSDAKRRETWRGQNLLGEILTDVRDQLVENTVGEIDAS